MEIEGVSLHNVVGILAVQVNAKYDFPKVLLVYGLKYAVLQIVNYSIPFISETSVQGHDRDTTNIQSGSSV